MFWEGCINCQNDKRPCSFYGKTAVCSFKVNKEFPCVGTIRNKSRVPLSGSTWSLPANIWRVRRPSTRRFLPLLLYFRMGFPLVFCSTRISLDLTRRRKIPVSLEEGLSLFAWWGLTGKLSGFLFRTVWGVFFNARCWIRHTLKIVCWPWFRIWPISKFSTFTLSIELW